MQRSSFQSRCQLPMSCVRLLLVVDALASAGCATTTLGPIDTPVTNAWLTEHDHDNAVVAFRDRPWDASLRGQLTREPLAFPPTELPFTQMRLAASSDERAIPLALVREVKVVKRGRGALEGALLGAGAGALSGATFVLLSSNFGRSGCNEDQGCSTSQEARWVTGGSLLSAAVGSAVGALVGAIIGHRDILTLP